MAKQSSPSLIADNRKARHDFNIHETYEAGIALTGTEIKSIRQGKLNLKDSFCRIDKGELLLYGVHISPYCMLKLRRKGSLWCRLISILAMVM